MLIQKLVLSFLALLWLPFAEGAFLRLHPEALSRTLSERPKHVSQINFLAGSISATHDRWVRLAWTLYERPSISSRRVASKTAGEAILRIGKQPFCKFQLPPTTKQSCYGFFSASNPNDPPISYSLRWDDSFDESSQRYWVRVRLGKLIGWQPAPVIGSDPNEHHPEKIWMSIQPGILWRAKAGLTYFKKVEDTKGHELEKLQREEGAYLLVIEGALTWIGSSARVGVSLAKFSSHTAYCAGVEPPTLRPIGYLELFDLKGVFNIEQLQYRGEDC